MSGITRPELQDTGTVECSFHDHMAFFPAGNRREINFVGSWLL